MPTEGGSLDSSSESSSSQLPAQPGREREVQVPLQGFDDSHSSPEAEPSSRGPLREFIPARHLSLPGITSFPFKLGVNAGDLRILLRAEKWQGQHLEKGRRIHQGNFASSLFPLTSRSWAVLSRDRLWSQGDQFSLFVIPWLCQLPGRVPASGLQLSTASASWIPILISIPGTAHLCKPGQLRPPGLLHPLCSAQAPPEGHHWPCRAFLGGFAPWHHGLQRFVTSKDCKSVPVPSFSSSPLFPPLSSFFFPSPGLLLCFPAVSTNLQLLPVHLKFHWYFGAHK